MTILVLVVAFLIVLVATLAWLRSPKPIKVEGRPVSRDTLIAVLHGIGLVGRVIAGIVLVVSGVSMIAASFGFWPVLLGTAGLSVVAGGVLIFVGKGLLEHKA